jgi:hypothetical protein
MQGLLGKRDEIRDRDFKGGATHGKSGSENGLQDLTFRKKRRRLKAHSLYLDHSRPN